LALGCGSDTDTPTPEPQPKAISGAAGVNFDPSSCGTITGLVTWVGPVPEVAPVPHQIPRSGGGGHQTSIVPLGNAPRIDKFTRAVAGTVVYLRDVEPARAKPWDLPPATVEFRDSQLLIQQGGRTARAGFVRRGEAVTFLSAEERFHVLRARGAAFFSFALPDADTPREHTFDQCGCVELTCGAGCFWQAAQLFVCDHPYYAITDDAGRFSFTQVPAGRYDLVTWHPNWVVERTERSPESGLPYRLAYAPPLEVSRPAAVSARRTTLANLTLPK
jgi:hypothetical protein